ncbi:MAG: ACT domain-containing protein, partial [Microbacterium sp.]
MTIHTDDRRDDACLIVHGPDRPGIVAAVSTLIGRNKGNIVALDQYTDDPDGGHFFQR